MAGRMDQAEIDALLKDSMFQDSQIGQSQSQPNLPNKSQKQQIDQYGNDEFQSYDESRRTFKNASKTQLQQSKRGIKNKLQSIKQEVGLPPRNEKIKIGQDKRPKAGIYFEQRISSNKSHSKEHRPYNFARITDRQRQLLLTTLSKQNQALKESLRLKDNEYKKLDNIYKICLKQKSQVASTVREATLQKQLATLKSKYDKLQQLCKIEKSKNTLKVSKTQEIFVSENKANQREEQLCDIIEQLRQRLISTTKQLKTLQEKMNQGENYVDQLKRKLRRIEQLQFKMQKMTQQAQNDRSFIQILKDKNRKLEEELRGIEREKKVLQMEVHRLRLGDSTQKDCFSELQQIRKEKQVLERNLRELTSNLMTKVRSNYKPNNIQDSGQLLKS